MKEVPPENSVSYQLNIDVEEMHIDALKHVNNVVYLQWVNDISEKHWAVLSNPMINSLYFWVCIRHEIDYINQAFLGDTLQIITWIGESRGVKSVRYVQVFKGGSILVKVKSTWCLIDAKTLGPTRIKEDILRLIDPELNS